MKNLFKILLVISGTILMGVFFYFVYIGLLIPYFPFLYSLNVSKDGNIYYYYSKQSELEYMKKFNPKSYISETENFHNLTFSNPIRLVILPKKKYKKFKGTGLLSTRLDGLILISKEVKKEINYPLGIFLHHEYSHLILLQRLGKLRFTLIPRWVLEGIAINSSNHYGINGYPTKSEAIKILNQKKILTSFDNFLNIQEQSVSTIKFKYTIYGILMEKILKEVPMEKLFAFLETLEDNQLFSTEASKEKVENEINKNFLKQMEKEFKISLSKTFGELLGK